ncbi:MAG TPA: phosphoribosyltransferase domain-containing protein, partial [Allosphingosinicella sp.]
AGVRSLLLVDDEVSTGTTLVNLAAALLPALPRVERIVAAALTDWSGGSNWLARMPRPASCASLLHGALRWEAGAPLPPDETANFANAAPALGSIARHRNFGRLGWRAEPLGLPDVALPERAAVRVVATGEFTYPPFLLAERLEQAGRDVVVQATSRSPALPGGAIGHVLAFRDNYATGLPNFLYNADPRDGRLSLICHETAPGSIDEALVKALNATCISF